MKMAFRATTFLSLSALFLAACAQLTPDDMFWFKLKPSTSLEWTACYDSGKFECTRLQVPLDYKNASAGNVDIALIRVPAKVDRSDPSYRGPVLLNPGGPGGSGVDFVRFQAEAFSAAFGSQFDVVGFDPRAVGRTTPQLLVWNDLSEQTTFYERLNNDPLLGTASDALSRLQARYSIALSLARQRGGIIAEYATSALVAQDMLSIVKAHGMDKLQYWGFSYGTVLGVTFASIFPNNVGRVIIDGVVDIDDYISTEWLKTLPDTDKVFDAFFTACKEAGPSKCALYDNKVSNIKKRVYATLDRLKHQVVTVLPVNASSTAVDYGIVDLIVVKRILISFLTSPYGQSAAIASGLAALEQGDGRPLFSSILNPAASSCSSAEVPPEQLYDAQFPSIIITCTDGDVVKPDLRALEAYTKKLANESFFYDEWPPHVLCSGNKVRSKRRYTGPFGGKTSFPLLVIGNTLDSLTPMQNAKKMAGIFKGARLLTQNSLGHTSLSGINACTLGHVRAYLADGKLPETGAVCEPANGPFDDPNSKTARSEQDSLERAARMFREANAKPMLSF